MQSPFIKIWRRSVCLGFQVVVLALILFPAAGYSADEAPHNFSLDEKQGEAFYIQNDSIRLDGKLDEAAWMNAQPLTDFIQQQPDEGAPSSEKTEIRVLYTRDDLYVGVDAFDRNPNQISSILTRRDSRAPSDWIKIFIDSYHDHRSGFEFSVNPAGVKRDVFWSNDRRSDDNWDSIWEVQVSIDETGWHAEFRIPFSQLRFPEEEMQIWGFQASRVISRNNETSHWSRIPKGIPQFCSLFGDLTGIQNLPSPRRLMLLPYTLGKSDFYPAEDGNPFQNGSDLLANAGLDLKYGLTSNLTIDATFNPDFGQVEADPADVNLSAYETYFREKRPFFMEGNHMLNFSMDNDNHSRDSLFYSRRIGRSPQGYPSDAQYYQRPDNTTILGAVKLTGKTAGGWSIGILDALTGQENAQVMGYDHSRYTEPVEPMTNYFLSKMEREFRNGRTAIGFIMTAVNRSIRHENLDSLRSAGYSGGLSFRHRWRSDTYEVTGSLLGSHIKGSEEAIELAQLSSARYFQRPDADHLELDPTRTSLSGYAGNMSLSKIGGEHWRWTISGKTRSPGFEVNDMGYLREVDSITQSNSIRYNEYKPGKIFREYDISLSLWNSWDYSSIRESTGLNLRSNFRFLNYWNINFSVNRQMDRRSSSHLRGGPSLRLPGYWDFSSNLRTDSRKNLYFNLRGNCNIADNNAVSYGLSSEINIRPSQRIQLSISPKFNDGFRNLQYVTQAGPDESPHYILSRIDQTTISMTMRLDYTITPNLSMQIYSQPFISAGDYSEFKEVIDPLAKDYSSRWHVFGGDELVKGEDAYTIRSLTEPGGKYSFEDPDFNFRQFRLNFVVRWEYLPGSTMFLVWTNGINDSIGVGEISLRDDLRQLFSSPSNNIFLFKLSYWFSI